MAVAHLRPTPAVWLAGALALIGARDKEPAAVGNDTRCRARLPTFRAVVEGVLPSDPFTVTAAALLNALGLVWFSSDAGHHMWFSEPGTPNQVSEQISVACVISFHMSMEHVLPIDPQMESQLPVPIWKRCRQVSPLKTSLPLLQVARPSPSSGRRPAPHAVEHSPPSTIDPVQVPAWEGRGGGVSTDQGCSA